MRRLPLVLAASLLLASGATAQAPRIEPPAGGLVGPTLGGSIDQGVPPSVPSQPSTPDLVVDLPRLGRPADEIIECLRDQLESCAPQGRYDRTILVAKHRIAGRSKRRPK